VAAQGSKSKPPLIYLVLHTIRTPREESRNITATFNEKAKHGPNGETDTIARSHSRRRFDDIDLRRKHGNPYTEGTRGGLSINERYFVARFAKEHMVIFDLIEREFYFYNPDNGAWHHRTPEEVREMFSQDWQNFVYWSGKDQLLAKRTSRLLESLTSQLRGFVGGEECI
jgi:hypothetical protein